MEIDVAGNAWNVGLAVAPLLVRTYPLVDGVIEEIALLAPPARILYCVRVEAVIADVPFPITTPVSVAAPVPPLDTPRVEMEPSLPVEVLIIVTAAEETVTPATPAM